MGLTGIWREKPCKKNDKKRQKSEVEPSPNRREREKSLETFEKVSLKRSRSVFFFKIDSRYSIDRKAISINRNKQRLT